MSRLPKRRLPWTAGRIRWLVRASAAIIIHALQFGLRKCRNSRWQNQAPWRQGVHPSRGPTIPTYLFSFALPTLAICVGLVSPRVAAPHRALPFSKVKSPGGLSFLNRHYPLASPGHCGTIPCVRGVGGHATDCGVSCGACPGAAICLSRFHAAITDFRAAEGQKSIG